MSNTELDSLRAVLGFDKNQLYGEVLIDSMLADTLLMRNKKNRPIKAKTIMRYSSDMMNEKWDRTSSAIAFNNEGVLTDGQHRLYALSLTRGIRLPFHIMLGVEYSLHQDTGVNRTLFDNMSISDDVSAEIKNKMFVSIFKTACSVSKLTKTGYRSFEDYVGGLEKYATKLNELNDNEVFKGTKAVRGVSSTSTKATFFLAYLADVPLDVICHIAEVLRTGVPVKGNYDLPILGARDKIALVVGFGKESSRLINSYINFAISQCLRNKTTKICKDNGIMYDVNLFE